MLILMRVVGGKIVKNTTFVPEAEKSPCWLCAHLGYLLLTLVHTLVNGYLLLTLVHTLVTCYLLLCILTEDNDH